MTTQENIDDLQLQIDELVKQANKHDSNAATWTKTANTQDAWLASWSWGEITRNKEKYLATQADNIQKLQWAKDAKAAAKNIRDNLIPGLEALRDGLFEELKKDKQNERDVKTELGKKGLTFDAVLSRETEIGKGLGDASRMTAESEAKTAAKKSNVSLLIILAVAAVIITAGGIFLFRKVKK